MRKDKFEIEKYKKECDISMKEIYVVYKIKDFYDSGEWIGSDYHILKAFDDEDEAHTEVKGKWKTYYKKVELIFKKEEKNKL